MEAGKKKKKKKVRRTQGEERGAEATSQIINAGPSREIQRYSCQAPENLHIKRLRMPQKPGCDSQRVEDRRVFVTGRRQSIPRIRRRQNAALSAVTDDSVRAVKSGEVVGGNGSRDYNYPIECCG